MTNLPTEGTPITGGNSRLVRTLSKNDTILFEERVAADKSTRCRASEADGRVHQVLAKRSLYCPVMGGIEADIDSPPAQRRRTAEGARTLRFPEDFEFLDDKQTTAEIPSSSDSEMLNLFVKLGISRTISYDNRSIYRVKSLHI